MDIVSIDDLQIEWDLNQMSLKRRDGRFIERIVNPEPALNPRYRGGESRIILLFTPNGRHIGTIHEIAMPDGTIPHVHPKDYTRHDCTRVRSIGERQG